MSRYIDVEPSKIDEVIKTELGTYDTVELKEMLSYYSTTVCCKILSTMRRKNAHKGE